MAAPSAPPRSTNEAANEAQSGGLVAPGVVQLVGVSAAARIGGCSISSLKRHCRELGGVINGKGEYLFDPRIVRARASEILQRGKRDDGAIEAAVFVALAEGRSLFDIIVEFQLSSVVVENIAVRYAHITGGKLNGAPLRRRRNGRLEQFRNGRFESGQEWMVPVDGGEERRFIFEGEDVPEGARRPNDQTPEVVSTQFDAQPVVMPTSNEAAWAEATSRAQETIAESLEPKPPGKYIRMVREMGKR